MGIVILKGKINMNKLIPKTDTEFRISFAQSYNLAVALVAGYVSAVVNPEGTKNEIEKWQKYFYQKLVGDFEEAELKANLNQLNSDKSDKKAKAEFSFVEDLEQP